MEVTLAPMIDNFCKSKGLEAAPFKLEWYNSALTNEKFRLVKEAHIQLIRWSQFSKDMILDFGCTGCVYYCRLGPGVEVAFFFTK